MKKSSNENISNNFTCDTSISCDGSWQKRGYSSMNGFLAAIAMDTGKVLDVEHTSHYCKSCILNEELKKSDPIAYAKWKATHQCLANYHGSAQNMEVTGAQRILDAQLKIIIFDMWKCFQMEIAKHILLSRTCAEESAQN